VIRSARAFVQEVDMLGLQPQGAFWASDHDTGIWRFHLATVLANVHSLQVLYGLLRERFPDWELPGGVRLDEVSIDGITEQPFFQIAREIGTGRDRIVRVQDLFAGGRYWDAVVYYADPRRPTRAQAQEIARVFTERVRARAAAAPAE